MRLPEVVELIAKVLDIKSGADATYGHLQKLHALILKDGR